jgi:hypothetical protein
VDACIFCREPFGLGRARSDEHAAPQWCAGLLPPVSAEGRPEHVVIIETAAGREELFRGVRDPFTTVAEDVCVPCNTGWMHELEEWAERWLAKPIQGEGRALRYWRQVCAASWAVKTALVWELVEPEHRTIPLEVLNIFHKLQRPGGRQQVWLGRYQGSQPHNSWRRTAAHHIEAPPGVEADGADGYLVVVTIGELAIVVLGHLFSLHGVSVGDPLPGIPLHERFPGQLIQIWPLTNEAVSWPPPTILDDAALDTVVRSLGRPIEPTGE